MIQISRERLKQVRYLLRQAASGHHHWLREGLGGDSLALYWSESLPARGTSARQLAERALQQLLATDDSGARARLWRELAFPVRQGVVRLYFHLVDIARDRDGATRAEARPRAH